MNVLIYSDMQATEGHHRLRSNPEIPLQRWRVEKAYEQMAEIADEYRCEAVFDLGDTTDDRQAIPIPTLQVLERGLNRLVSSRRSLSIKLIGNHEQALRSPTINSGSISRPFFGHVVETVKTISFQTCRVIAASYHDSSAEMVHGIEYELSRMSGESEVILVAHASIIGHSTGHSTLEEGIPRDLLSQFKMAFLGHIHTGGQICQNAWYVGSPFQQDFGEDGPEEKGVIILDLKTFKFTRVPLRGFPRYRRITVDEMAWIDPSTEDRIRIDVPTVQKAQEFYSDRNSSIAEPIFTAVTTPVPSQSSSDRLDDLESCMRAYLESNPPESKGLMTNSSDMLAYGMELVSMASED